MDNKLIDRTMVIVLSFIFLIEKNSEKDFRSGPDPESDPDPLFPGSGAGSNTDPQH